MRALLNVVDNVFGSIRLIFLLGFGAMILFGLFMTVGATVVAPEAMEMAAGKAERLGEKAIEARERAIRDEALAREGWGFSEPRGGTGAEYQDGERVGGWGSED